MLLGALECHAILHQVCKLSFFILPLYVGNCGDIASQIRIGSQSREISVFKEEMCAVFMGVIIRSKQRRILLLPKQL